ncbi:disulfide bond formation protein B [Kaarinaea lacus]
MSEAPVEQPAKNEQAGWNLIFICWILATVATLGSLFFSEVMGLKPCVLCWYQRIFMYPLVVIFLVGMFPLDRNIVRYALPLAVIGWGFAVYHYLVYSGYIPESLQPCDKEASCAEIDLELFGFITIPMMSILTYTAIIVLLVMFRNKNKHNIANQNRIKQ